MSELTERNRAIWSAGDWDDVADYVAGVGPRLLEAAGVPDGARVLDVGTGSGGNVAIPAALRGARVTGLDLTDAWFDAARRRAGAAGVEVDWVVGDAMDLPFPDASFDRVFSTFGHMFAPDHTRTAHELARVCAGGGVIAFATWRSTGWPGEMFRALAGFLPPPPPGVQPPPLWGDRDYVASVFGPLGLEPVFTDETVAWDVDGDSDAYVEHFAANFGPLVMARKAVGDRWPELMDTLRAAARHSLVDGHVRADYLITELQR